MSFIVVRSAAERKKVLANFAAHLPAATPVKAEPFIIKKKAQPLFEVTQPAAKPPRQPLQVAVPAPEVIIPETKSIEGFNVTTLPLSHAACGTKKAFKAAPPTVAPVALVLPEQKEEVKEKPRVLKPRTTQLQELVDKCSVSGKHLLWKGSVTPKFSLDGKYVAIDAAAYCLYNGTLFIPSGQKVYATCRKYNCIAQDCLILVENTVANARRKPTEIDINEILRLQAQGKSNEEIAEMLERISPAQINKVDRNKSTGILV